MSARKLADPNKAVAFLVRHEMTRDDARLFVSYLTTGLVSKIELENGMYRIGRVTTGAAPLMFEISARALTTLEREQEAVTWHACPVCPAKAAEQCMWPTTRRELKHPERVRLAREPQL